MTKPSPQADIPPKHYVIALDTMPGVVVHETTDKIDAEDVAERYRAQNGGRVIVLTK